MDPIANIKRQRELAEAITAIAGGQGDPAMLEYHANELGELVIAQDDWRKSGGFDPYSSTNSLTYECPDCQAEVDIREARPL